MSDFHILIPIHKTQQKALYNIHMGRDVRTDIPESETDDFMSLANNYPVLYEYCINKYPDRYKDGDTIEFWSKKKSDPAKPDKLLTSISKMTTDYLGKKARVKAEAPKEPPKVEEPKVEPKVEPKKKIVSENGGVAAAAEPERPPPNPTVPLPVEISREDVVDFPVYGDYRGEKIYIQGKPLKGKDSEAAYYGGWIKYLNVALQDYARNATWAYANVYGGAPFFPVIEMANPQKSIWGELAIEIARFYHIMKSLKEQTDMKTGWNKKPIPEEILEKRLAYNQGVMKTKNDFNKYLLQKYAVLMPGERPPETKQNVVSESGAVKLNPKLEQKIFMPKSYPVVMVSSYFNIRNPDATPNVEVENEEEYLHFIKEGYYFSED